MADDLLFGALEKHTKQCVASGSYMEADIVKQRLIQLHQHEDDEREASLRARQVSQRLGIEEAHMLEFQSFNVMWDRTMREYDDRAKDLLETMRQRHKLDLHELCTKSAASHDSLKRSPILLDLRRTEQALATQGEFAEAHEVKLRADHLEASEWSRASAEREQQLAKAEAATLHRQDKEVSAIRQRIQTGAEEQRVARQQDLERLLRRYHNIKAELESQQRQEANRRRRVDFGGTLAARALRPRPSDQRTIL